jgi:hypothetical protein
MGRVSNCQLVISQLEHRIQQRQQAAMVRMVTQEDSDDSSSSSGTLDDLIDESLIATYNKVLSTRYLDRALHSRVNNCRFF